MKFFTQRIFAILFCYFSISPGMTTEGCPVTHKLRFVPGLGQARVNGFYEEDAEGRLYFGGRLVQLPNSSFYGAVDGGITELEFNKIIDEIVYEVNRGIEPQDAIYPKMIASQKANLFTPFQPTLVVEKNWASATLNAFADQLENNTKWVISMFGGLARHSAITKDGFAFVVCHEIGHHTGGFPYYSPDEVGWAAAEGQADYYASNVCLKRYFMSSSEQIALNLRAARVLGEIPNTQIPLSSKQALSNKCEAASTQFVGNQKSLDKVKFGLCLRVGMAGKSFTNFAESLMAGGPIGASAQFNTPSPYQVIYTNSYHPFSQCRLDTVLSGALCSIDGQKQFQTLLIPGKDRQLVRMMDPYQTPPTSDLLLQERESLSYACGRNLNDAELHLALSALGLPAWSEPWGYRPACWYKTENIFGPYLY